MKGGISPHLVVMCKAHYYIPEAFSQMFLFIFNSMGEHTCFLLQRHFAQLQDEFSKMKAPEGLEYIAPAAAPTTTGGATGGFSADSSTSEHISGVQTPGISHITFAVLSLLYPAY